MILQPSATKSPGKSVEPDQRRLAVLLCLVLAAITLAVFGQTMRFQFVDYDDNEYVYENPMVQKGLTLKGVAWAFDGSHADNWHPVTWLSHMLDCQIYGLDPAGPHLTNVLIHTAVVILLFLVLREMTGFMWRSAFVAAVFAIHPLRAESVAWVAERKDVLSGLFFVLTIGAYTRYARQPGKAGYAWVMALFALGLMSKPMLVTLPLVLLLLDYWPLKRIEPARKLIVEKLPFLALSAASCLVTLLAQHKAIQSTAVFSMSMRFCNALITPFVYLRQMAWPAGLAAHYRHPPNGFPLWQPILAAIALVVISSLAWMRRRSQPWLLVGWFWFLVMLLPVIGIVQVGGQSHADRYTYLPQIGVCLLVTWLAAECLRNRIVCATLMTITIAVFMVCAWKQTGLWKESETLWTHEVAFVPNDPLAWGNLGTAILEKGRTSEAIPMLQRALQLDSNYIEARFNLASAELKNGNVDEAVALFQSALKVRPDDAKAHNGLGLGLMQQKKLDEAAAEFQKALQLNPDLAPALYNLGTIFEKRGKTDEAAALYEHALLINPDYVEANYNLGNILLNSGHLDDAIAHYQRALQDFPNHVEALINLGTAYLQKGNMDEAASYYQSALQIDTNSATAHLNLGLILLQKGAVGDAIDHFQKALKTQPNLAEAHSSLANAFASKGRPKEAIDEFERSLQLGSKDADVQNGLAWLRATAPDAALRNGSEAVALARKVNQATGGRDPMALRTLAAALAEDGQLDEAKRTLQQAMNLLPPAGAALLNAELKCYEAGRPFRQK